MKKYRKRKQLNNLDNFGNCKQQKKLKNLASFRKLN